MKEATTITHPQPPSSTPVDGAMVLMLLLPSRICDGFHRERAPGNDETHIDLPENNNSVIAAGHSSFTIVFFLNRIYDSFQKCALTSSRDAAALGLDKQAGHLCEVLNQPTAAPPHSKPAFLFPSLFNHTLEVGKVKRAAVL